MGKVTKKASEKHNVSLSPAIAEFIQKTATLPLIDLPSHLSSLPARWPFPRGDLYNWIEVLDRFDSVLETFISHYGLNEGPQTQAFERSILLGTSSDIAAPQLNERGFGSEGDRELVEAILNFSRLLLDKCGNRALYNSTERLNDLLNTTSLSLLHSTLRLTTFLAHRFAERNTPPPHNIPSFYSFDNDRFSKLAAPFTSQTSSTVASSRLHTSRSAPHGEESPQSELAKKSQVSADPNDFRALTAELVPDDTLGKTDPVLLGKEWQAWVQIKTVWLPAQELQASDKDAELSRSTVTEEEPVTPTPVRRQTSMLSRTPTTLSMQYNDMPSTPIVADATQKGTDSRIIELCASDLLKTDINTVLRNAPSNMPTSSRYELLQKLRIAYALMTSPETRTCLLETRLLALTILAYIHDEHDFPQKVFGHDANPSARQQLVHQIVSLLQLSRTNTDERSLHLQSLAIDCTGVLARQRAFSSEIATALAPSSSHGLLLSLAERVLKDIQADGDDTDNKVGDEWREAVFLLLSAFIIHGIHSVRSSEAVIHPSLVSACASGLRIYTNKALRVHLRILDFMKNFARHFKDGLQVLAGNDAFTAASEMLDNLTRSALELLEKGQGIAPPFKTKVTDYQILYMHQQVIRSMIDLVNDVFTIQGGNAERVLRNLVDSQAFLNAFKCILSSIEAFGAHTWSEVVKAIVGFLHNEPTSYTIISEAGIIQTLLDMVSFSPPQEHSTGSLRLTAMPSPRTLNIPPVADAIVNLSQAFGAICLTNAGFDVFKSSGVLGNFFHIFESPEHVKAIKDANTLALLGSTFDELARHHASLKPTILSVIITMLARVRYICRSRAWQLGAGPKLWILGGHQGAKVAGGHEALALDVAAQTQDGRISRTPLELPNSDVLELDAAEGYPAEALAETAGDVDADGLTVIDYARPAIFFLMNFFENQQNCIDFMAAGGSDIVLDFITLPSLPPTEQTFGTSNAIAHELTNLIHMMAETKPAIVIPALVDRARHVCTEGLSDFLNSSLTPMECFFEPFVRRSASVDVTEMEVSNTSSITQQGTKHVKSLTTIFLLVQVLSEVFNLPIFSARSSQNTLFINVNIADTLAELCRILGDLNAACFREEIALQNVLPENWLLSTRPENFSTGDDEVDRILNVSADSQPLEQKSDDEQSADSSTKAQEELKQEKETPTFKNAQTLRYLLIETPNAVTEFFQRLGRGMIARKRLDTFTKQKAAAVAKALADAYVTQLAPHFLSSKLPTDEVAKRCRFGYLVVALANVRGSLFDDSPTLGPSSSRQAFVVDALRRASGLDILTRIGTECFDELKSCQVTQSTFSANAGLKICLDIFDDLCDFRSIVESNQGAWMKSVATEKPFYFNPAQVLLELRMKCLPLVRAIWDSDYADQASNDVVQKLVSVLKHVFNGESEADAIRSPSQYPKLAAHPVRKFIVSAEKVAALKEKGYPEDLAREALYRSNVGPASTSRADEEYCKAMTANPQRRRLPIPTGDADTTDESTASAMQRTSNRALESLLMGGIPSLDEEENEFRGDFRIPNDLEMDEDADEDDEEDNEDENYDDGDHAAPRTAQASGQVSSAMDLSHILNQPDRPSTTEQSSQPSRTEPSQPFEHSVTDIDEQRDSIREQLPERCNNILNNHHNLTFELSELILSASQRLPEEAKGSFWESTSTLLVNSLLSMQADDTMSEVRGKKVAAAAHLTALLIQESKVFKSTLKVFQDSYDELLSFLEIPAVSNLDSTESSAPWIAPILLILERILSLDAEPPEVHWQQPPAGEQPQAAKITYPSILKAKDKERLFGVLMKLLPHVGKDKSMALSIVRVLVILTRARELAVLQGERGNLQSLFMMIRQLGNGGQGRLQNSFMLILRHIIEDDETIKQIMRSEIVANFSGRTSSRQIDISTFLRENYHLVLRSPALFVEVANEKFKLSSWTQHGTHSGLVLMEDDKPQDVGTEPAHATSTDGAQNDRPAESVEDSVDKAKAPDLRPPVLDHQDGVIHFLLSELLAYKDVEDKEQPVQANNGEELGQQQTASEHQATHASTSTAATDNAQSTAEKQEKGRFKGEEHPIFMYRCFLLHCLTELLYSYNRTKVEFINFSRKMTPNATTPSKPRSGVLNYLLNALVCSGYVDKDESIGCKKKMTTSDWAIRVIVALCWKTGESGLSASTIRYAAHNQIDDQDNEPALSFVRRFALEHAIKAFKDATSSVEPLQSKYSRLLCLGDLFHRLLQKSTGPEGSAGSHNTSYKMLGRMMFEKNLIAVLTASLAEIDLSFSSARKVIKFILRPLQELTTLAVHLSINSPEGITSAMGNDEDVISSASSVADVDDEREETPDLFRNSALGMLDPSRHADSESSEDEDEDEEMYDDGYEDEMEYDDGLAAPNDGEVVSDEELDEGLEDAGPIEGLPGDQPVDIEFVMDEHTDPTDSDDDEDEDSDDEDEDDDNDDFDVEMEDEDELHEATEHDHDGEDDWEDEDDDDEDNGDEDDVTFEGEDIPEPIGLVGEARGTQAELNNLLRVLGEHDDFDSGPPPVVPSGLIIESDHRIHAEQEDDDDDDDDEGDEGDDLDENDGLDYDDAFNPVLDGDDLDESDQWGWDEPPPAMFRRHRHSSAIGRGHLPFPVSRRIHALDPEFPHIMGGRHHRHAPQARSAADHTVNPLLQRPDGDRGTRGSAGNPFNVTVVPDGGMPGLPSLGGGGSMISMQIPIGMSPHSFSDIGGHGAVLDALLQAVSRNGRGIPPEGFRLQIPGPPDLRDLMRSLAGDRPVYHHHHHHHHHHSRPPREDPGRVASFTPMLTSNRWQEEARMLFGNAYLDKLTRINNWILSYMVPLAQEEDRERQRKRVQEEEQRKKEADEAERRRVEEERLRKEREEREAAETAAAEARMREEAEAAAAAAILVGSSSASALEVMEGVQSAPIQGQAENEAVATPAEPIPRERVFTTIRGRQLDITDLEIDREYLDALPEELREEVIMQQYTERRQEAQDDGENANSIDPDFLNALPEDIREEIRQQEAHLQRRREQEAARRQAAGQGSGAQAEEMDNDNFFATLDPALRRAILAEQPPEILSQLDPRHAAEGRAHQRGLFYHRMGNARDERDDRNRRDPGSKDKRQVVQLIDKAGVATLLRLMFLPHQGSLRQNLWQILSNVSGNRQTRFEVISLLLVILKEGSADVNAVERSLASLSLRAKAVANQKTPQSSKRTLSTQPQIGLSDDITPLLVVQQCLGTLQALCRERFHVKTIFLREVDVSTTKTSKKSKGKENKSTKYPLNDVIALLDRRLIIESSSCLQSLAELLKNVTEPLPLLIRKDKTEESDFTGQKESTAATEHDAESATIESQQTALSGHDVAMTEATVTDGALQTEAGSSGLQKESKSDDAASNDDDAKKKQPFEPPEISEHNLRLVTSVFVTPECHNETFHFILDTVRNLSSIPGTNLIFSKELINHVQNLSQSITSDLDELLPLIKEAQSTSDLQGATLTKFSASSSDQAKLLRVLQALDYLSAPKKEGEQSQDPGKSILNESYGSLALGPLWYRLSECLSAVREKGDTIGFANILLYLIESLMVVCKNTPLKDAPKVGQAAEAARSTTKSSTIDDLEELFFTFTAEHRKILNDIVRQNPKLMQGHGNFSLLVKNSKVLDFDNKRNFFTKQIHGRHAHPRHVVPPLQLSVDRNNVFLDSYKSMYFKSAEEMKYGKLNIRFKGEEGVDAGGVTREWFQVLSRGMFDPNYALFTPVASDRTTFHPSKLSHINPEHLQYFKFIGRIIGKALHEGRVLDCHFSRAVYKRILGKSPNLKDLESNDVDYYKSLVWILENDITDILTEEFCVIESVFGEDMIVDLIPDGRDVAVTDENKKEYVQKLVEYRLTESVKEQLDSFLQGFHDIIPADLVAIFNEQELELLISGLPEIDVDDWKANSEYHNYSPSSPQIVWFWRIVRGMSNEERAKLLQFITGTSKVPLNGFKELEGVSGLTKFNVHKDPSTNRLPTSHTCFNQLDLPAYDSFELMKQNIMTAINLGADYFGFA